MSDGPDRFRPWERPLGCILQIILAFMVMLGVLFLLLIFGSIADAESVAGAARVIDGNTLEVASIKVRLAGMDAPERGQTCQGRDSTEYACGAYATRALRRLMGGDAVTCAGVTRDRYGRMVADGWAMNAAGYGWANVGRYDPPGYTGWRSRIYL